ncbi:MAG: 30S ribosomal protein S2 [Minisyncoccales bacterium]
MTHKFDIKIEEMGERGVNLGHKTSRLHPNMEPYVSSIRNGVHIINLEKTAKKLEEALERIQELVKENKTILLVGTKIQNQDMIEEVAKECSLPYVNSRWLGGTFTNFKTIKKRVDHFKELEKKKEEGELEKYTKKERAEFDRELEKLRTKFAGLRNLKSVPDAVFIIDMHYNDIAVKEAQNKDVEIIGLSDTNVDPTSADYFIPANDDAIPSVEYILNKVKKAIKKVLPNQSDQETGGGQEK